MKSQPAEPQFLSEPITPARCSGDAHAMACGVPGAPSKFTWRGEEYSVERIVMAWKQSGRERGGSEIYLRRHWFQLRTTSGHVMTLYCDRQAKNPKKPKQRWWIYTLDESPHAHDNDA